jgi:hypothetical protein
MIDPGEHQPDVTPAQREEWERQVARVDAAMREYTKPFVTPISRVLNDEKGEHGKLEGTGTYVQFSGRRFLLTNEHVAEALGKHPLAHQFLNCDDVFRTTNPFLSVSLPFDVAISSIDQAAWVHSPHNALAIYEEKWAVAHGAPKGEIFFFKGYAGEHSDFHFNHLISNATSYATQEVRLPEDDPRFDSRFHFALDYRPDRAIALEKNRGLPDPHGFSGSLVWNTRFVDVSTARKDWSPHCAVLTGLVWGWPSNAACLVATRAEHVRSCLLRLVQP